jgi:hypothetical protein
MGLFNKMLQNTTDRFLYAIGSSEAEGRLNRSYATAELRKQWGRYAGRKGIRAPTIRDLSEFLTIEYGADFDRDHTGRNEAVDLDEALPKIANALLDRGMLVVSRD